MNNQSPYRKRSVFFEIALSFSWLYLVTRYQMENYNNLSDQKRENIAALRKFRVMSLELWEDALNYLVQDS